MKVLGQLADTYKGFADAAAKRYSVGEINVLEKTNAESRYQQVLLQQQQAEADVLIYQQQLQQWLGTDSTFILPANAFVNLEAPAVSTSGGYSSPMLNYYEQNANVAAQEFKVEKSGFLPDLSVGYFNQQIEGVRGLQGLQLGVGIPLFFWTQQGKVQAAKIGSEIAEKEYENQVLAVTTSYQTKQQEVVKYMAQVKWYEAEGLKTADELLRFADKGYKEGEIDYVEYINSTGQAVNIKTEYLKALNEYNQAVTDLQYLSGSYNK